MYNSLIKYSFIIGIVFILSGCSANGISVRKEIKEDVSENQKIYLEIPSVVGFSDKEYELTINQEIKDLYSSIESEFKKEISEVRENQIDIPQLSVEFEEKLNDDKIFSLVITSYRYISGANGTYSKYVKNIDLKNNRDIKLDSLFNDDEYKNMLNSKLEQKSKDAIYSDLWETPTIRDNQNEMFYFTKDGLVIFYPPYELSYYARGFVEFTIEYSQLYGYLNPDYTFLYDL